MQTQLTIDAVRLVGGRWAQALAASLLFALPANLVGCKKDEPPPPLPEPQEPAAATEPLTLEPEDAGLAAPEPKKKTTRTRRRSSAGSLAKCCAALKQNAASAPEPTKGYMNYASQICDAAVASGKNKASMTKMLEGALKGAGLPPGCK